MFHVYQLKQRILTLKGNQIIVAVAGDYITPRTQAWPQILPELLFLLENPNSKFRFYNHCATSPKSVFFDSVNTPDQYNIRRREM